MDERRQGYLEGLGNALTIIQNVIDNERAEWGWIPRNHVRRRRERDAKLALGEYIRMRLTERVEKIKAPKAKEG
jgi:hypothetical protein